jgi:hypothetical protein
MKFVTVHLGCVGRGGGGGVAQIQRNEILPSMYYVEVSQCLYSLHQCINETRFTDFLVIYFQKQGDVMNLTHFAGIYC